MSVTLPNARELASLAPPARHARHALHEPARTWPETNCYVDLWVELLHARGFEPTAMLAFTVGVDWEGDQWTFFKPPAADLEALYGVDVRELNVWRALPAHLAEHVGRGRVALVEVDAHFLPDTAGVTYREGHAKTTIGVDAIDVEARALRYFHNAGRFELAGDDYDGALGLGPHARDAALPPYAELAVFDRAERRAAGVLRALAREQLVHHAARIPGRNAVAAYADAMRGDVAWLALGDLGAFHRYAFATLRQCGAAWELAGSFLRWLGGPTAAAATHFEALAADARTVQLRLARVAHARRGADLSAPLAGMAREWDRAVEVLRAAT